jgi:iron complex transport system permease protein
MGFARKWVFTNLLLLLILIVSIVICTAIGPVRIPVLEVFRIVFGRLVIFHNFIQDDFDPGWVSIIWNIRLPAILLGVLVGTALASAGTAMQGLFKNPLADPFIIGVSAGAAFGAAISIAVLDSYIAIDVFYLTPISAFVGALLAVYLVYNIAREKNRISVTNLLLAGIAVNLFLSALTSLLIYIYIADARRALFWLMGSLGASRWTEVQLVAPIIIVGVIAIIFYSKELNILLLGDETAKNLGVDTERVKKIVLFLATLVTAAAVTVSGVIGFVGLIIPHMMRLIVGPDHRILLPTSALMGGIFVIWCDAIARVAIAPGQIPVALITSILGGPFFIYLLWRRKFKKEVF